MRRSRASWRISLTSLNPTFAQARGEAPYRYYQPACARPTRCLTADKLRLALEEFRPMEAMGIVRLSDSPWVSPLHMIPKADEGWRPCGDYRCLNDATGASRTSTPISPEHRYFPRWTSCEGTIKFRSAPTISQRRPFWRNLVYSNLYGCRLV